MSKDDPIVYGVLRYEKYGKARELSRYSQYSVESNLVVQNGIYAITSVHKNGFMNLVIEQEGKPGVPLFSLSYNHKNKCYSVKVAEGVHIEEVEKL